MKAYKQLFLEIANSTDCKSNRLTGASWQCYVDETDRRVYVQFQETKTWQDWIFNIIIIPVKLKPWKAEGGTYIKVPLGNYLQFKSVCKEILETVSPYVKAGYTLYITGWSQGGVTAGELAYVASCRGVPCQCIMYGTPKFLKDTESVFDFHEHVSYINFLYPDDPIRGVVPGYERPSLTRSEGFVPDFPPESLDDKHRIYGHAEYTDFAGRGGF